MTDHNGWPISDWRRWVRPKSPELHWKCGRSAMELARAWFTSREVIIPKEIEGLFNSHSSVQGISIKLGCPEIETKLPHSHRGPRNHDLWLKGYVNQKLVTICVEAKADESFGNETIGSYWSKKVGSTSKVPDRIAALLEIAFGVKVDSSNSPPSIYSEIPYQLLTGYVGTLLQASNDGSDIAIFIIHEFHTDVTDIEKIAQNEIALNYFFELIPGIGSGLMAPGKLYGPIACSKSKYISKSVELFFGRAIYDW